MQTAPIFMSVKFSTWKIRPMARVKNPGECAVNNCYNLLTHGNILTTHAGKDCCTSHACITQGRIDRPIGNEPYQAKGESQMGRLYVGEREQQAVSWE